jgi:hypothetical protein
VSQEEATRPSLCAESESEASLRASPSSRSTRGWEVRTRGVRDAAHHGPQPVGSQTPTCAQHQAIRSMRTPARTLSSQHSLTSVSLDGSLPCLGTWYN